MGKAASKPDKGTVYFDFISQPSRAILILSRINKFTLDEKQIALLEGQHKTEEYKKINPFSLVPALVCEDGWSLTESVAIGRYLCSTQKLEDRWYPADPRARARVDQFLSWHHTGLRAPCIAVFIAITFTKMATGSVDDADVKEKVKALEKALSMLEECFLKDRPFVATNEVSIADLWGACEVHQLTAAGYDISKRHPLAAAWLSRVQQATQPHFDDVSAFLKQFGSEHAYDFEKVMPE